MKKPRKYISYKDLPPERRERIREKDKARYELRKDAKRERQKVWYKNNRKPELARRRARHDYDPRPRLLQNAKKRAEDKWIEFSITIDDIPLPSVCPVLGIPIVHGGFTDGSASIDRLDCSKGYVPGNVIIMSQKANRLKNNGTTAEIRAIADFMEKNGCP